MSSRRCFWRSAAKSSTTQAAEPPRRRCARSRPSSALGLGKLRFGPQAADEPRRRNAENPAGKRHGEDQLEQRVIGVLTGDREDRPHPECGRRIADGVPQPAAAPRNPLGREALNGSPYGRAGRTRNSRFLEGLGLPVPCRYRGSRQAGVAESVDATDLIRLECSRGKPRMQNRPNSGEPVKWQSRAKPGNGKV